jgi:hypothetical protein
MKGSKKVKKQKRSRAHRVERLKDLARYDLRKRMHLMAEVAQDLMRDGEDNVFVAAIIKGEEVILIVDELVNEDYQIDVQSLVIASAITLGADCLVTASEAWMAPDSQARPSLHPERKHVLAVCGKDYLQHLVGAQRIHRHGNHVILDDLEISETSWSWLNWYPALNQPLACC